MEPTCQPSRKDKGRSITTKRCGGTAPGALAAQYKARRPLEDGFSASWDQETP
jgi:hypothetical protein